MLYLIMSIVNIMSLNRAVFDQEIHHRWSKGELYKYTKELNIMKLAHACILVTLTVPIAFLTTRKRVTTKKRYGTLLILTLLLEVCYIIPLVFVMQKSLEEKN